MSNVTSNGIVDVNVTLGRWPLRRLPLDDTAALIAKLRSLGITQAWAGTFDAVLHRDLGGANQRLADDCRRSEGFLLPFGSVNPLLPDWEEELRRCHETYKMPGIRLFPNYHGYKLDHPDFARLLRLAADRQLIVQIVVGIEDDRGLHPLLNIPAVDPTPVRPLLKEIAGLRLVFLSALRSVKAPLAPLLARAGAYFDLATQESVGGIANLVNLIGPDHVLFGTFAPYFYPESATLKMKESALPEAQTQAIFSENAKQLLARRP